MSTYSPNTVLLPSGLDELGLMRSIVRLPNESLSQFKRRILLEQRAPVDNSLVSIKQSPGRQLGLPDIPAARISLNESSVVPRIKITSSRFYVWSDITEDPVLGLDICSRGASYFLGDLITSISAIDNLTVEILNEDYFYKYSRQLRLDDTFRTNTYNLLENYVNKLPNTLVDNLLFSDVVSFANLVSDSTSVQATGDYFVDKVNGVVFSYDLAHGYVNYSYSQFPFILYWQPVRCFPLNDEDIDYLIKDPLINNEEQHLLLNARGATYYNELLDRYPLEWGQ